MEEIGEGIVRLIYRFFRYIIIDALMEIVCFWIGRVFLLIITLGRYPRGKKVDDHEGFISFIGLLVIVTVPILLVLSMPSESIT